MTTREFPEEQAFDLIDDAITVETKPWRHGTRETLVFEADGSHWRVEVCVHPDEGVQLYGPLRAVQVHKVTKTVEAWEPTP